MSADLEIKPRVELGNADLGDARLAKRLARITSAAMRAPEVSFPELAANPSELTAIYRFFRNKAVKPQGILEPHARASVERARHAGRVLVVHDTTEVGYSSQRKGLGPIDGASSGFMAHVALAIAAPSRLPLGVLGLDILVREAKEGPSKRKRPNDPGSPKESTRWIRVIEQVSDRLSGVPVVHVMDSEGDNYEIFHTLLQRGGSFVIRLKYNRNLLNENGQRGTKLRDLLLDLPERVTREASLSPRYHGKETPPAAKRKHPARPARKANLRVSAYPVTIAKPHQAPKSWPEGISFNIVHVTEPNPPEGQEPVDWLLATTQPIDTDVQIHQIVDDYRARWTIEEFFKAMKTGCAVEQRQIENGASLLNVFATYLPIAAQMLQLRTLARDQTVMHTVKLSKTRLSVLQSLSSLPLSDRSTAREAFLAIARLGGHLPQNGEPGWLVLSRGFRRLLEAEALLPALRECSRDLFDP